MENLLVSKGEGFVTQIEKLDFSTPHLEAGEVLLSIEKQALTANVISYASVGVAMGYYDFFPVEGSKEKKKLYGRVPTWGICKVVQSKCDFVPVGQRVYGLVPISKEFKAIPKKPSNSNNSWIDSAKHRAKRDVVYNTYTILDRDVFYSKNEEAMILLRPLFLTAWLLREALNRLDIDCVVITSASSKTGASLGALCKLQSDRKYEIVGLTSPGNFKYTESLNFFDRVETYSSIFNNPAKATKIAVVDMTGNTKLLKDFQIFTKSCCKKILSVGGTNFADSNLSDVISGEGFDYCKPEFFFAPKYMVEVFKDPKAVGRIPGDWEKVVASYPLEIKEANTIEKVEQVLQDFYSGKVPGNISWVARLNVDQQQESKL